MSEAAPSPTGCGWGVKSELTSAADKGEATRGKTEGDGIAGDAPPDRIKSPRESTAFAASLFAAALAASPVAIVPSEPAVPTPPVARPPINRPACIKAVIGLFGARDPSRPNDASPISTALRFLDQAKLDHPGRRVRRARVLKVRQINATGRLALLDRASARQRQS
jgi:hypothetical protein